MEKSDPVDARTDYLLRWFDPRKCVYIHHMMAIFENLDPQVQGAAVGAAGTFVAGVMVFVLNWVLSTRTAKKSREHADHRADWVEFRKGVMELVTVTNAWYTCALKALPELESRARKRHDMDVPLSPQAVRFLELGQRVDELLLNADVLVPHDGNFELVDEAIRCRNEFQRINSFDHFANEGYGGPQRCAAELRLAVLELRNVKRGMPLSSAKALDVAARRGDRFVSDESLGGLEN